MEVTQITDYNGRRDNAYALLALPSKETQNQILSLLTIIKNEFGAGLWTMPAKDLHITLCEIIQPKPYSQDKQRLYDINAAAYENVPAQILKNFKPIKVHFNAVAVSPQAIFISGEDDGDGSFNKIRKELTDKMPLPDETKLPPDIVHSSIARFTEVLDLGKLKQIVAKHTISCDEFVKEFKLVNVLVPPFQQYKVIRTYRLGE